MKIYLYQSCGHCWVFRIWWYIECSTLIASSFRIWHRSAEFPSPPLALLTVMLPKVHLCSHSWLSGSRWETTPLWLSGSWRPFLYIYSVNSCHLFLISSASVRSIPFLSFIVPIFAWKFSWLNLKSFPFYLFPLFLCIDHWGMFCYLSMLFFGSLHSNGYSFPFLLCLWLFFFSQLFVRSSSDNHFAFLFLGDGLSWWSFLITASCTMSWTSIHSSSGTLSDLISWIYLSLPLYNCKGFDLGHTCMV